MTKHSPDGSKPQTLAARESKSAQPTTDTGYGEEGTNKTIPVPREDAAPSEELLNTKTRHIEKSPYTRG